MLLYGFVHIFEIVGMRPMLLMRFVQTLLQVFNLTYELAVLCRKLSAVSLRVLNLLRKLDHFRGGAIQQLFGLCGIMMNL